jgi:hypothetical protein
MKIRIFAFISVLMVPAVSCLIYAWRALRKNPADSGSTLTRAKLLAAAIYPAALSQILVLGFLLQGFHGDRQSFAGPAPPIWALANWITVFAWLFVVGAVAAGRGSARRPLFLWTVIAPVTAWLIFLMGYDY